MQIRDTAVAAPDKPAIIMYPSGTVVTFGEHEYVVLSATPVGERLLVHALPRGGRIHALWGETPLTWEVVTKARLGALQWPAPE